MELVYFTAIAAVIYLLADRILRLIEKYLGRTLEHRSIVFFVILLFLALASFSAVRYFTNQAGLSQFEDSLLNPGRDTELRRSSVWN